VEVGCAVQAAVPNVPVIGIGAGGAMAGQVLVCDDLLGLHGSPPSFVKMYADLAKTSSTAYSSYVSDVRNRTFPGENHARKMRSEELAGLREHLQQMGVAESFDALSASANQAKPTGPASTALGAASDVQPPLSHAHRSPVEPSNPRPGPLEMMGGWFLHMPRANAVPTGLTSVRAMSHLAAPSPSAPLPDLPCEMQVLRTREQVHEWRRSARRVALVPTMGNLHEGHLELVDEAKQHADDVLVTIFVNPAQFSQHEDLDTYPRTMERDLELLRARGATAVFTPTPGEMYPHGSPGGTVVVPRFVQGKSEDACRPDFFTGVATVCLKLFNLCKADVVVFGQKDAMQCAVISRMLEDLMLGPGISLVVGPTSREADGLARSSRNSYLTADMRQAAPAIFSALDSTTRAPGATPGSVRSCVSDLLTKAGMLVSYVSVADPREMSEKEDGAELANSVVSVACLLRDGEKECRLIDNVVVPAKAPLWG